jgi:hypothetical protein
VNIDCKDELALRGAGIDHGAEKQRNHQQSDDFKSEHLNPLLSACRLFIGRSSNSYGSKSRKDA